MARVVRYDFSSLDGVSFTKEGFMKCDAVLARTGVQTYRTRDGQVIREYRPPEEVFRQESMDSAKGRPVTNGHPPIGLITADTATMYTKGYTGDNVRREKAGNCELLVGNLTVVDKQTIEDSKNGKRQISQGYQLELEFKSGFDPVTGEAYDAIQRNIVHNHTAIVDLARAGSIASLRLDAEDAVLVDEKYQKEEQTMKIVLDGKELEVSDEVGAAIKKELAKKDEALTAKSQEIVKKDGEISAAKAEASTFKGKADALDAEVNTLKTKVDAVQITDAQIQEKVTARISVLDAARKLVKKEDVVKLDSMSELDIKKAVILSLSPDTKLDGKDAAYINGRFDTICELTKNLTAGQVAAQIIAQNRKDAQPDTDAKSPETARADSMKSDDELSKKPIMSK